MPNVKYRGFHVFDRLFLVAVYVYAMDKGPNIWYDLFRGEDYSLSAIRGWSLYDLLDITNKQLKIVRISFQLQKFSQDYTS